MSNTMTHPANPQVPFNRVAVLFSGGPAPGANAVISSCASSFQKAGVEVVGIKHGYSYLMEYSLSKPLVENQDYVFLNSKRLKRTRNTRGIIIGTARANPGSAWVWVIATNATFSHAWYGTRATTSSTRNFASVAVRP